jgi:hypothetical protein
MITINITHAFFIIYSDIVYISVLTISRTYVLRGQIVAVIPDRFQVYAVNIYIKNRL